MSTKFPSNEILREAEKILASERPAKSILLELTRLLRRRIRHYTWVGIYRVEGGDLVLEIYDGATETEHTRIPVGSGICGYAAKTAETIIVPDVGTDPRYLMCFPSTKSEIVVPILSNGRVVGEIDIDSDSAAAFDERDRAFLEKLSAGLGPLLEG